MADDGKDLKIKITADAAGASGPIKQVTADIEKLSASTGKASWVTGNAAKETQNLSEAFQAIGGRNNAAREAVEGVATAAQGGETAIFGLAKAWKGAVEIFRNVTPFGIIISLLGILISVVASFKDKAVEFVTGQEKMKKASEEGAQATEAQKNKLEELKEAAKASIDSTIAKIKSESEAFQELVKTTEDLRARYDALNEASIKYKLTAVDLAEAEKLRAAKTDEQKKAISSDAELQRAKIRATAEEVKIDNKKIGADLDIKHAEDRQGQLQQERAGPAIALRDAKDQEQTAKDAVSTFLRSGGDRGSAEGLAVIRDAQLAAEKRKLAEEALKKVDEAQRPELDQTDQIIRRAQTAKEVADIEGKTQKASVKTDDIKRVIVRSDTAKEREKKIQDLGQQAEEARDRGEFGAQDEAVAQIRKLRLEGQNEAKKDRRVPITQGGGSGGTIVKGSRLPNDKDIEDAGKKIDEKADQIKQAPTIDPKPIADDTEKLATAFVDVATQSATNVAAAASSITAAAALIPPPLDLGPLLEAQQVYAAANLDRHQQTERAVAALARTVERLAQQLQAQRSDN